MQIPMIRVEQAQGGPALVAVGFITRIIQNSRVCTIESFDGKAIAVKDTLEELTKKMEGTDGF